MGAGFFFFGSGAAGRSKMAFHSSEVGSKRPGPSGTFLPHLAFLFTMFLGLCEASTSSTTSSSVGREATLRAFQARYIGLLDFKWALKISSHFFTCSSVRKTAPKVLSCLFEKFGQLKVVLFLSLLLFLCNLCQCLRPKVSNKCFKITTSLYRYEKQKYLFYRTWNIYFTEFCLKL